ncbi:hypothetical protein NSE01_02280 [Novosphingobium sediminis]|uniref:Antifreeze glycopeptide polyprotein n=1 Tax=Novosphingobium sediminis TaxID=707214 RepID=A0A512AFB8_9SPHN|nr:hypothetical protein [Novosphingobium sediminis]GEN98395.1 hypothetical protein NSE01_02280 [Novosphingobium sediminis]
MTIGRVRLVALTCAAVGALSAIAVTAQESLLPPGFDDKPAAPARKAPVPPRAPASSAPAPAKPSAPSVVTVQRPASSPTPQVVAVPQVQQVPGAPAPSVPVAADSLANIDPALIDQLIASAKPRADIPPQAQRSLSRVGFFDQADGGFPAVSSHYLNGSFVAGLLTQMRGDLVSRWGHILLRRALASRLDTPVGMNGADWAALRAQVLLRMGEADAARAMVQEVDSGFYTKTLEDAAMGSFLATADPVGLCPITALTAAGRPGWDWTLTRAICTAFTGGEGAPALAVLDNAMRKGVAPKIDILLAQKFAGAASQGHRAVKIEWAGVDSLTPWRTGLALATGLEPPEALRKQAGAAYAVLAVRAPMLPLTARAEAADIAAERGIISAAAMVDLYSEIHALDEPDKTWGPLADTLRSAYLAADVADRLSAIRSLWGDASDPDRAYSRLVLTAYASARVTPSADLSGDAKGLIASMLTAGLDRNAARWASVVPAGSEAWGLIALAAPAKSAAISADTLGTFQSGDTSTGGLRSRFLLAGLMGLGRVDPGTARRVADDLKLDLARETRWTRAIDAAAASENPVLVALLAGFGMQGSGWDKMTPLHLYHIVAALRRVGLEGEARMIAAEAVARV